MSTSRNLSQCLPRRVPVQNHKKKSICFFGRHLTNYLIKIKNGISASVEQLQYKKSSFTKEFKSITPYQILRTKPLNPVMHHIVEALSALIEHRIVRIHIMIEIRICCMTSQALRCLVLRRGSCWLVERWCFRTARLFQAGFGTLMEAELREDSLNVSLVFAP